MTTNKEAFEEFIVSDDYVEIRGCAANSDELAEGVYRYATAEANKRIAELQASNNQLRQVLYYYREECTGFEPSISVFNLKLDAALATTPSESLQAFENEVLECAAKVADIMPMKDEKAHHKYRSSDDSKAMAWDIAFEIRALKEVK